VPENVDDVREVQLLEVGHWAQNCGADCAGLVREESQARARQAARRGGRKEASDQRAEARGAYDRFPS
jgi:hypothetical protein